MIGLRLSRRVDFIWLGGALLAGSASLMLVAGPQGWFGAALALVMAAIARTDARSYRIPDMLSLAAFVLGILRFGSDWAHLWLAFSCSFGVAALFFALRQVWWSLRGIEALGLGDVKLAAVAGLWLEPLDIVWAIEGAVVLALVLMLVRARSRGRSLARQRRVAFGAAFAPMIWCVWFGAAVAGGPDFAQVLPL